MDACRRIGVYIPLGTKIVNELLSTSAIKEKKKCTGSFKYASFCASVKNI
jgi:hypothetical protein